MINSDRVEINGKLNINSGIINSSELIIEDNANLKIDDLQINSKKFKIVVA